MSEKANDLLDDGDDSPLALLLVHGVGAQERGEMLRDFAIGLRRIVPELDPEAIQSGDTIVVGKQCVRLYEVYWADLMKGERSRGSFTVEEFTSLSWFPWFNYRRHSWGNRRYSAMTLIRWFILLPIASALFFIAFWGARLISIPWDLDLPRSRPKHAPGTSFWQRVREAQEQSHNRYSALDRVMDEYAGDVLTYANSRAGVFYREHQEPAPTEAMKAAADDIMTRFGETVSRARSDGCGRIQIVAHSLGSVIAYHYLAVRADPPANDHPAIGPENVEHLYTIGSPLEKFVFFWPRIMPDSSRIESRTLRWDNFVSLFDPVAGKLKQFDHWSTVSNHRLLGGGFFRAHVIYERSPVFLEQLAKGISGIAIPLRRSHWERLVDGLMLLGETLLTPAVLVIVLLAGLALLTTVALMIPFIATLSVRWWLDPAIWMPYYKWGSIVIGSMFAFIFAIMPLLRASTSHRAYNPETPET